MATISQFIEMSRASNNLIGTANTYLDGTNMGARVDLGDFDGTVTTYFEVALRNSAGAGTTAYARLWNKTDGVAVTGSEVTASNNTYPPILRSSNLSLSGNKEYFVQLKHSTSSTSAQVANAKIIVQQTGSITKTQTHHELGEELTSSSTSNTNIVTNSPSFLYESSKYDGTVVITHQAWIKATAGNTAYSGLYDVTASAFVTGSDASTTSTTATMVSSGAITLIDGHEYRPTMYVSAGGAASFVNNKIVITQTGGFTKLWVSMQLGAASSGGDTNSTSIYTTFNTNVNGYVHFDPADFSGITLTPYFEAYLSPTNSAHTSYADVQDYVLAVSATNRTGTEVSYTGGTTPVRRRTTSWTIPTSAADFSLGVSGTNSGTARVYNGVIYLEGSIGSVETLKTDQYTVAFSAPVVTYTRTHTTDSLKRKASTTSHTTNSNKKKSTVISHTTNSLKRKANTNTHTTSSVLRKAITKNHTTDSNKRIAGNTRTHTTSAVVRRSSVLTHTTSSNKRVAAITRTHTTDAQVLRARRINKVTNPSIENGLTNWQNGGGISLTTDTVGVSDRTNSVKFVSDGYYDNFLQQSVIPVIPGHTYRASVRVTNTSVHTANGAGSNNTNTILYLYWQSVSGEQQWTGAVINLSTTHDRVVMTGTATAPTGATALAFNVYQYGVGTAWYDSFIVEKVTYDLQNANFENIPASNTAQTGNGKWMDGTVSGSATNIGTNWHASLSSGSTALFDTANAHSGIAALKGSTTSTSGIVEIRQVSTGYNGTTIPIIPGYSYTLSYWMKTNYVSGDSNNGAVVAWLGQDASGNDITTRSTTQVKTTTGWTQYSHTFTASANEYGGHLEARIYGHTGTANLIMDAWYDDILFTQNTANPNYFDGATYNSGWRATTDNSESYTTSFQLVQVHTTDANKRKATTVSHTTSSVVRKSQTKQHSTDANKRVSGVIRIHTTDSLKRKATVLVHTTDSLRRKANTVAHTTSSVIRKSTTRTHSTDANKRTGGLLRTHTTDALKRKQSALTHTTDTLIYRSPQTLSVDYFDFTFGTASYPITHSTDALKHKATVVGHATDSNKKVTGFALSHTTNSNNRRGNSVAHTTDSLLRQRFVVGGYHLNFNGVNNDATWTNVSPSLPLSTDNITISGKFRLAADGYNGAESQVIIGYKWYYLHVRNTTNQPNFRYDNTAARVVLGANLGAGDRSWHTFVGIIEYTGGTNITMTLFLDGVKTTSSQTTLPTTNIGNGRIGRRSSGSVNWYSGDIKNIRIYHTALTDLQAADVANGIDPIAPVVSYKFYEGTGTTLHDSSGNGNDATINGATWSSMSHSTSSVLRKANTASHTTDSSVRKSNLLTHTTSAFKRKATTVSHTSDANKRKATLVSHTADSNKKRGYSVTHTTDSNKKKTANLISHTTDALKRKLFILTHITDALKRKANVLTHTTSSVVRKVNTRTHTTDSFLRKANTRSHTTDANRRKSTLVSHSTDANRRKTTIVTHTADANKRKSTLRSHTTDSLVRKANTVSHTTSSVVRKTNTVLHTADANKRKATLVTHTTSANKRKGTTVSHTTSANTRKSTLQTHTTDANKRLSGNLRTHTTNSLLRRVLTRIHTTDALKRKANILSHSTSSFLRKATTILHTTSSNKRKATLVSHTTDIFSRTANQRLHSTDTNKRRPTSRSHTTDSLLRKARAIVHTTSTVIRKANVVSHSVDANKRKSIVLLHTTSANKRKLTTVAHTADSNKRKTTLRSHTADANKRKVNVLVHLTDSNKRRSTPVFHLTDANKRKLTLVSHSTNANKRKLFSLSHSTSANKRTATNLLSHTTDSFKRAISVITHTTDALKRTINIVSHRTDASKYIVYFVQHSTSTSKKYIIGVSHSTNSRLRKRNVVVHTTDSSLWSHRGTKKVLVNGQWAYCPVEVLIGGNWVVVTVEYFDGVTWKLTGQ